MSNQIEFPLKAYRGVGNKIYARTFEARESKYLTLEGQTLKYNPSALFGDYGNEPEYWSADLDVIKAMVLADLNLKYQKAILEIKDYAA